MVSKGQFVGLDWNRIARLHSQVLTIDVQTELYCYSRMKSIKSRQSAHSGHHFYINLVSRSSTILAKCTCSQRREGSWNGIQFV